MASLNYIIIVAFLILVNYIIVKKFLSFKDENNKIPKEFRPIIYIIAFIFLTVISLMIYTSFFTVHYNF